MSEPVHSIPACFSLVLVVRNGRIVVTPHDLPAVEAAIKEWKKKYGKSWKGAKR